MIVSRFAPSLSEIDIAVAGLWAVLATRSVVQALEAAAGHL